MNRGNKLWEGHRLLLPDLEGKGGYHLWLLCIPGGDHRPGRNHGWLPGRPKGIWYSAKEGAPQHARPWTW